MRLRRRLGVSSVSVSSVSVRRLRPIAITSQHGQARIFHKPPIFERKFAHHKNRTAIGFDASHMLASRAQTWVCARDSADNRCGWNDLCILIQPYRSNLAVQSRLLQPLTGRRADTAKFLNFLFDVSIFVRWSSAGVTELRREWGGIVSGSRTCKLRRLGGVSEAGEPRRHP